MQSRKQAVKLTLLTFFSVLFLSTSSFAAHPLITDDTGTQGEGNFQLEINSEFSWDKETEDGISVKETAGEVSATLSYGPVDTVDIVLGLPYQWFKVKEDGVVAEEEDGISDISLEVKWRFYENEGLSLALKPGVSLPTGDDDEGLGTGEVTYGLFFITTKEVDPWAFHLNIGYTRNENNAQEREDIWHASLASEVAVIKDLKLVANIGMETNPDTASNTHPAFILGGLIYAVTEDLDLDMGIKGGLNRAEADYAILAGLAWRF